MMKRPPFQKPGVGSVVSRRRGRWRQTIGEVVTTDAETKFDRGDSERTLTRLADVAGVPRIADLDLVFFPSPE